MTIADCTNRLQNTLNGKRVSPSVDGFKFGDPGQELTGIVTTFAPSFPVLLRACELKANLIITHEPTFYSDKDTPGEDDLCREKMEVIDTNRLVVWRFHDQLHAHNPDAIHVGLIEKLGFDYLPDAQSPRICRIPPTTFGALCNRVSNKLGAESIGRLGPDQMRCEKIGLFPGASGSKRAAQIDALGNAGADVIVCGETGGVSAADYVSDALEANEEKGIIILGHCHSEEPGMEYLAEWLKPILPDVPISFIPAGDPFWSI